MSPISSITSSSTKFNKEYGFKVKASLDPRFIEQEKYLRLGGNQLLEYNYNFCVIYHKICLDMKSSHKSLNIDCDEAFLILTISGDLRAPIDNFLFTYEDQWSKGPKKLLILVYTKNFLYESTEFLTKLLPEGTGLPKKQKLLFLLVQALALRKRMLSTQDRSLEYLWTWIRNGPFVNGSSNQNLRLEKIEERIRRGYHHHGFNAKEMPDLELVRIPYLPILEK